MPSHLLLKQLIKTQHHQLITETNNECQQHSDIALKQLINVVYGLYS